MKLLLLFSVIITTSCTTTWVKDGSTKQDWFTDKSSCKALAGQACGHTDENAICRSGTFEDCLRGKGWREEKKDKK